MTKKKINLDNINALDDLILLKLTFEEAYLELESIVSMQQNDTLSLEENIKYYKVGNLLSKYCQKILNEAKLEIDEISKD